MNKSEHGGRLRLCGVGTSRVIMHEHGEEGCMRETHTYLVGIHKNKQLAFDSAKRCLRTVLRCTASARQVIDEMSAEVF